MTKKTLLIAALAVFALAACDNVSSSFTPSSSLEITSSSSEEVVCRHSNLQHTVAKDAGCDEGGNLEYYYCPDCETYYDAQMQEADLADLILEPCHTLFKHDANLGREVSEQDYYECSKCHKYFNDDEASLEYQQGEWITDGTAHHWLKSETIKTKAVNALTLAELEGKAFSFDFKFKEDGYNYINFGQTIANTWTISGTFTLTRTNGIYSTDKGVLSQPDANGWVTCTINKAEFTGTGPKNHGADGLDVVFGGWKGYTDTCHAEFYLDGDSVKVCDPHN